MEPKTLKVSLSNTLRYSCLLGASLFSCPWAADLLLLANTVSPQTIASSLAFAIFILPSLSSALTVKDHLSSKPPLSIRGGDLAYATNQTPHSISPQHHTALVRVTRQSGVNRQPHRAERRTR